MWRTRFPTVAFLLAGAALAVGIGRMPPALEGAPAPAAGGKERVTTQPCTVQAFESVQLYSAVPGYLQKQTVDIGDRVKKGQVLAEIDAPLLVVAMKQAELGVLRTQGQVREAEARLLIAKNEVQAAQALVVQRQGEADSAKALLTFKQQRLERIKKLYEIKSVDARLVEEHQQAVDAARADSSARLAAVASARIPIELARAKILEAEAALEVAKTGPEGARLALDKARILLSFTRIVAPFDGVVTQRNFFPGDFVRSGGQGSHPLLTVVRIDLMRVVVPIPDRDVPLLERGAAAEVTVDALPGVRFNARVSRVGFEEDPKTHLLRAEIDIPNPKGQLRPGMYGSATIHLPGGAPPAPAGRTGKGDTNLKKLLVDEARTVYEQDAQRFRNAGGVEPERLYLWSRRWLQARLALAANKEERAAAYRDHLQRMADLERYIKALARSGQGRAADAAAGSYFRLQAQFWLSQAQAG